MRVLGYFYLIFILVSCNGRNEKGNSNIGKLTDEHGLNENYKEDYQVETKIKLITDNTRFVLIKQGLSLYQNQDTTSEVITIVKLGEPIEILEESNKEIEINNLKGSMVKVNYQDTNGYIFSGGVGHYPIPTFAMSRNYYKIGDIELYIKELQGYGMVVDCQNDKCSKVSFPKLDAQEAYLIAKLLWPGLMGNMPYLKNQIIKDDNAETEGDFYLYEGDYDNDDAYSKYGTTEVFFSNYLDENKEINNWEYYFFYGDLPKNQAIIAFSLNKDGIGRLVHSFNED
ncbi:SH3 domain-containing protein [Marinigracilibium pacificum]|uniref:SH3 domain-containing protein n=1 Tax=Marinigracilibium pacificum TaxID=2729599 RepID=A0A848J2S1_9BACT|nr:SH3 domain-containing protein [Marinigracilibium pacificum]NMM50066.1 SH3 domain-containing protein [Marinigracilibium pacificum]